MLYGIFKGCLIETIPGIRTATEYITMTGQSAVQALPWFNVSENACNAGLLFLAPAEQVIAQDQTEYDNAKSKKVVA